MMADPKPQPFPDQVDIVNCVRCNIRCRAVAKRKKNASHFVKGTKKTGKFCANCLVVDFIRNAEFGPASAMGDWHFNPDIPIPPYLLGDGKPEPKRFNPECLRLPHMQVQFAAIIVAASNSHGAELTPEEIDWDEIIANWHLPFPKKGKK